jgi:hypothetical protein
MRAKKKEITVENCGSSQYLPELGEISCSLNKFDLILKKEAQ